MSLSMEVQDDWEPTRREPSDVKPSAVLAPDVLTERSPAPDGKTRKIVLGED